MESNTREWTERDTQLYNEGVASGLAIDVETGKPMTLDKMRKLAVEFDKVRSYMSDDEFIKGKVISKPFDF